MNRWELGGSVFGGKWDFDCALGILCYTMSMVMKSLAKGSHQHYAAKTAVLINTLCDYKLVLCQTIRLLEICPFDFKTLCAILIVKQPDLSSGVFSEKNLFQY